MTPSSAHGPTPSCGCGTARSSRRRGAGRMALPEASAWAIVIGVVLVAAVIGFRPLLARLAARNIGRRKSRGLIVVAGLLDDQDEIGRAHVRTPVTWPTRMP